MNQEAQIAVELVRRLVVDRFGGVRILQLDQYSSGPITLVLAGSNHDFRRVVLSVRKVAGLDGPRLAFVEDDLSDVEAAIRLCSWERTSNEDLPGW